MKVFSLICLFIGLAQCQRPHPNCWKECDWTNYVALVKCPYAVKEEPAQLQCTCEKPSGANDDEKNCMSLVGADDRLEDLSWENCKELAADFAGSIANTFFRWEDKKTTKETYCYFLPDCNNEVPSGCVPFDGSNCVAGPSTTPCDYTPAKVCDPAIWNEDGIHWTCLSADKTATISPYTVEKIANGTTCQTVQECSSWIWGKEPEPENPEDPQPKKIGNVKCGDAGWESANPDLQLFYPDDTAHANEIFPSFASPNNDGVCKCETLPVSEEAKNDPALSLVCEQVFDPADLGILPDNACALLCDGHFMKYIECYKGVWMNTAEYPFVEVTTENIKC